MKRTLFGTGLAVLAYPAWAQTAIDYESEAVQKQCGWALDAMEQGEPVVCDTYAFDSISEIVVVGERIGYAEVDELTAPASTISGIEIEDRGQGELAEILRSLPSLSVSQSGPSTGLTQLRLRGAEANQMVVLIDGVEVANPIDGAFDFGGLRAEDVVRVEVLRGEQSALYGADAVAGVINIVTRTGATREGWRASLEAGSRDTVEGYFSGTVPVGIAALTINGNAFRTDGYDISDTDGEDDAAQSRSFGLGLNGMEVGPVVLSAKYGFIRRDSEFDEDVDFDGRLEDTDSESTVETTTARVEGRWNLSDVEFLAAVSRAETETDTRAGFSTLTTGTRDQATLVGKRDWGAHVLTALAEYEDETYAFAGDPDSPSNDTWGIAGDYGYTSGNITITASARFDSNDLFDDSLTWRAGAGFETEAFGRFTASVGTGVKNPSLIELFGFFPASRFVGNADLQPETSTGYNLGWSYDLGEGRVSANYFRSELEDEIVTIFNPDFTTGVANLDTDSTREGIEFEGWYSLGDVYLQGTASFPDSEQDGAEEIRRPDFLASVTATWQASDALRLTAFVDHTGTQLDADFATFSNVELDAFTLVGASVAYDVTSAWQVYARGTNLLDEDYEEVVGYRSPPRALFVGLRADY